MKSLWIGLLPVVIFWFFEEKFGTFWGLVAAIVWAMGECGWEYFRYKKIDRLTLMSTALVVVLGVVSLWLDKSIFFKFQPVITEFIFAGILLWQSRKEESWLWLMAQKTNPQAFSNPDEAVRTKQKQLLGRMTKSMVVFLILHSVLLGYVAFKGTTGQWAFWKGVGLYILFFVWFVGEFVVQRLRRRN